MDYGFLDIGRDKAYHILFVFAQEWTRFLPFFFFHEESKGHSV